MIHSKTLLLVPIFVLSLMILVLNICTRDCDFTQDSLIVSVPKLILPLETNGKGFNELSRLSGSKNIILWTHGRSGSKFVGNILASGRSTFFMQEPIHSGVGTTHFHPERLAKALSLLKNCLACNFRNESAMMKMQIKNLAHFDNEPTLKYLCRRDFGLHDSCVSDPSINELVCRAAKLRVFRVISLNFKESRQFLEISSLNVSLVHLIRDPRAAIFSMLKINTISNITSNVIKYCSIINKEITYVESITSLFPGRYFIVRYEDLANSPLAMTRKLFSRLGLQYTISVASFVRRITSTSPDEKGYHDDLFGINRISENTLAAWRRKISYNLSMAIQNECKPFLKFGKYVSFQNENDLRDESLSAIDSIFVSTAMP